MSNIDSSLISLLNQKKAVIKTQSVKGNELIFSKSLKTDNTITCNTLRCDNIDIDPSQPTIIKNAQITASIINSTSIGIHKHSKAKFTEIVIDTLNESKKLESFKLNGDIVIQDSSDNIRQLYCENPFTIKSSNNLIIDTSKYLTLIAQNDIKFITSSNIEFFSTKINLNTSQFDLNSKFTILNNHNVTSYNNASVVLYGGMSIQKDINIYGKTNLLNSGSNTLNVYGDSIFHKNLNILNNVIIYNNTHIYNTLSVNGHFNNIKTSTLNNLNIYGFTNIYNETDSINSNTGSFITKGGISIAKNPNSYGINTLYNETDSINSNTGSLIINGGTSIKKNLNVNGNINFSNTIKDTFNVYSNSIFHTQLNSNRLISNFTTIKDNLNVNGNINQCIFR